LKNDGPIINVFNRQRKFPVDTESLENFLVALTKRINLEIGFSVVLVSDPAMQKYNARFAGKSRPTDVLSFPAGSCEDPYLGDIIISVESAQRQYRTTLESELRILALHGVLHLMGYDHERDDGEMVSLERGLRKEFGLR